MADLFTDLHWSCDTIKLTDEDAAKLGNKLIEANNTLRADPSSWPTIEQQSNARYHNYRTKYESIPIPMYSPTLFLHPTLKRVFLAHNIPLTRWYYFNFASVRPSSDISNNDIRFKTLSCRYQAEAKILMIDSMSKKSDMNLPGEQVPTAELMFRGINDHIIPEIVVQRGIVNTDTIRFIEDVKRDIPCSDGIWVVLPSSKWFPILLGSDNGRPVQQMVNYHPASFHGATVTRIEIVDTWDKLNKYNMIMVLSSWTRDGSVLSKY